MTELETERKEREMNTKKIEHKDVRVILNPEKAAQAPPDIKKEGKLIDWAEALHENAMLIAAAGVLATEGSLDKAASVLWWARFEVPAGYFPSEAGHEGNDYSPNDEEALRLWVEGEAERIEGVIGLEGFRLAASGSLMNRTRETLPVGAYILFSPALEALGLVPQDFTRLVDNGNTEGASMVVPDPKSGEPVPMPLGEMGVDDYRRVRDAIEARRMEYERLGNLHLDIAARMEDHGCAPNVTVGEFLANEKPGGRKPFGEAFGLREADES